MGSYIRHKVSGNNATHCRSFEGLKLLHTLDTFYVRVTRVA